MTSPPLVSKVGLVRPLTLGWEFQTTGPSKELQRERARILLRARPFPRWRELRPPRNDAHHWVIYFVFAPDGKAGAHHRYTLSRIRHEGLPVLVVCACEAPEKIPGEVRAAADALYWKAPFGWDFSGYTVGLRALARHSPGTTALLMNDSVFGPFHALTPHLTAPPWAFTGFTAFSWGENHIQSYAFIVEGISPRRIRDLRTVFSRHLALDDSRSTIVGQELRMARVAARRMSVGAYWFSPADEVGDPTLVFPFQLMEAGFPFLKRSLLGHHSGFQPRDRVLAVLEGEGHPLAGG